MCQVWALCVFGCRGTRCQDHVRHYFDDCIVWNYISDTVPGFVADLGPRLFGLHFQTLDQIQLQILGVALATQVFLFRSKNPLIPLERLVHAVWTSRTFYSVFLRAIARSSASSAALSARQSESLDGRVAGADMSPSVAHVSGIPSNPQIELSLSDAPRALDGDVDIRVSDEGMADYDDQLRASVHFVDSNLDSGFRVDDF